MMYPVLGFAGVFGVTTCVLLVGAATVLIFGVPTRGLALEEIAEPHSSAALNDPMQVVPRGEA
jgi:MFS transporter, putative metabolite:H+ symporter